MKDQQIEKLTSAVTQLTEAIKAHETSSEIGFIQSDVETIKDEMIELRKAVKALNSSIQDLARRK